MVSIGSQLDHPAIARKGRSPSNPTPPQSLKSWTPSAVAKSKLPATCSLWSTTNCDGSPHDDWLGRVRGKRSRPQRLFTKHIYASSGPKRVSLGMAAATSSPSPPRRCGGFWSRTPVASGDSSTAGAEPACRSTSITLPLAIRTKTSTTCSPSTGRSRKLADVDIRAAELVKLRYFAGLTNPQAAEVLGVSPRTADLSWAYARAWLKTELQDHGPVSSDDKKS